MALNLPPKQDAAIRALLTHNTVQRAADAAGVPLRTLVRWRGRPDFQAALDSERRRLVRQSSDHLRVASVEAVAVLRSIMCDPECNPAIRVQAAACVLANAYRAVELDDVVRRIDRLEEAKDDAKTRN